MRKYLPLFFLFVVFSAKAQHSSKGKEFWIAYMENLTLNFNGPPSYSFFISSEVNTSGQVIVPFTGYTIPFTVNAMQDTEIVLPPGVLYPQGDEDVYHFGFKVVANDSVNVCAYHHRPYFTEASVVMPVHELTSYYMITAQKDDLSASPSEFVVEATQDSTTIEIVPSQVTISFRPPGLPFYKTLNAGEVLQVQSYFNLAGTTITSLDSSKKIAVFSGARQSSLVCSGADDHLYDQDYMAMFGREFIVVPMLNQGGDVFNILTLQDSNYVSINNNPAFLLPTKGQYVDTIINNASRITSEKPICIAQFNKSQSCNPSGIGDPCMVIIPPVNLLKYQAIFNVDSIPPPPVLNTFFSHFFLNIVVPAAGASSVMLDGNPVTGFQTLSSNPLFSWKQSTIVSGRHHLTSLTGFNAFTYGLDFYNGYAFHLGFDFYNSPVGMNSIEDIFYPTTIFPNPLADQSSITISAPGLDASILEVYSSEGKLILSRSFSGKTVSVNRIDFSPGFYFYLIRSGNKIISRNKFLVI